jgi:hypothetical protein
MVYIDDAHWVKVCLGHVVCSVYLLWFFDACVIDRLVLSIQTGHLVYQLLSPISSQIGPHSHGQLRLLASGYIK